MCSKKGSWLEARWSLCQRLQEVWSQKLQAQQSGTWSDAIAFFDHYITPKATPRRKWILSAVGHGLWSDAINGRQCCGLHVGVLGFMVAATPIVVVMQVERTKSCYQVSCNQLSLFSKCAFTESRLFEMISETDLCCVAPVAAHRRPNRDF